jgi:replication factor A1
MNQKTSDISLDDIVKKIMIETGLTVENVNKRIDETITSMNGLLTKIGAALVLADKLRVKIDMSSDHVPSTGAGTDSNQFTGIGSIVDGMRNVNIAGRVVTIYPAKEFTKKDGNTGKVASMLVKDATGTTRVTLWDQNTRLVNNFDQGDIVGVFNATVKKGLKERLEITTSKYTGIKKNPPGIDASTIPAISDASTAPVTALIKDITGSMPFCTFTARVEVKTEPRTFNKKDGTTGTLGKVKVTDSSASGMIVFWTERMNDYDGLKEGDTYEFAGLGTKFNTYTNELEFNVNKTSRITPVAGEQTSP